MAIAMKDFAAMLRRKGGTIGAAKVADILDDCDRAAIALEDERDALRGIEDAARAVLRKYGAGALRINGLGDIVDAVHALDALRENKDKT